MASRHPNSPTSPFNSNGGDPKSSYASSNSLLHLSAVTPSTSSGMDGTSSTQEDGVAVFDNVAMSQEPTPSERALVLYKSPIQFERRIAPDAVDTNSLTNQVPTEQNKFMTVPEKETLHSPDKHIKIEDSANEAVNPGRLQLNPAQLLNPRQHAKSRQGGKGVEPTPEPNTNCFTSTPNAQPTFQFASTSGHNESESEDDGVGMSSFLERSHRLVAREDSPAKRPKLDLTDPYKKSHGTFGHINAGGIISEHIKEQRKKANESDEHNVIQIDDSPGSQTKEDDLCITDVVDLTAGNNSDDSLCRYDNLIFIDDGQKGKDPEEAIVCYGKLDGAKVTMHTLPEHKDHKGWTADQRQWKALQCRLWRLPNSTNFVIHVRDYYNKAFGTIDLRVARALAPLMDSSGTFPGFKIDARLDPHTRAQNSHFGDAVSEQWPITLNVFGQIRHATAIGGELRKKNVFLGAPTGLGYGVVIHNPHAAERATQHRMRPSKFGSGGGYVTRTNEQVERDINSVFDRVRNHDDLKAGVPAPCVLTPLLAHQLQCLTFMLERESEEDEPVNEGAMGRHSTSLWRTRISQSGRKTYYNVITGNEERAPPPPVRGGILADQMGLGKTLEALAHFASTLEEARYLEEMQSTTETSEGIEIENVGTTLLICPKNVMSNWEDQIATHLREGSVSFYLYYGQNRIQDLKLLRKYDLIITTYSIVSSELNRRSNSVLKAANWFRIILDEGHMIREQSTLQSKAVCDLEATRRWVLTGTPVQNKLEDLGALLKFLRLKPFDAPSNFSQYIIAPLKVGNMDGVKRLRTLVDVITLRRLKDRVNLLPRHDVTVKLNFSKEEQTLYSWVNRDAKNRVRLMDDKQKRGGRQMGGILRLISCLRMISDHGKELVREDELPDTKGISSLDPLVLDDDDEEAVQPPLVAHAAYEMYHLVSENDANDCIKCSKKVAGNDEDDDPDKAFGVMLRCYDLVCIDCVKKFKKEMEKEAINGRYKCPMCHESSDFSFFELTQTGVDQAEDDRKEAKLNPSKAKKLSRYEKPHTKTWALLAELNDIHQENEAFEISPPIKSVVFTEWTSHIDLLEIALKEHAPHIKYVRLDGSMSRKQQNEAMDRLRDDDKVTLMLISIKAGGVGINLISASRVFVMEPNWNPAAEAQAIDRVHRLGQKRPVKVTRFIMADSIEEQIAKRQGMKRDLADMSMNRKVENIKAKMDRFKELFR